MVSSPTGLAAPSPSEKGGALEEKGASVRAAQAPACEGEATAMGDAGPETSPPSPGQRQSKCGPKALPHGFPTSRNVFLFLGESC